MYQNSVKQVGAKSSTRITSVDGIRAVAILLVLLAHTARTVSVPSGLQWLIPYVANGKLGVMLFFVLSGYLITYILRKESEKVGYIDLRAFYIRRAVRILPAFYVYMAVVVVLRTMDVIHTSPADVVTAGSFLLNYRHCLSFRLMTMFGSLVTSGRSVLSNNSTCPGQLFSFFSAANGRPYSLPSSSSRHRHYVCLLTLCGQRHVDNSE